MSVNIRYPNITGFTDKEQITQIRSYLHQLVEQLNYALSTMGADGTGQATYDVQGGNVSYYELQSMIVQEIQKLDSEFEKLSTKLEGDVDTAVDAAMSEAKESGEFDGPKGEDGVSPTITISAIEGGTRITIKDANGSNSIDVMNGTVEYPDMILNTEYATGEKYNGVAVYAKALTFGPMPNTAASDISLGTGITVIGIDGYCVNGNYTIPLSIHNAVTSVYYNSSNGRLYIETTKDASAWTAYLTVKYTKA